MTPLAIDQALRDPRLLGAGLGDAGSWSVWIAVLKAAFGLDLSAEELAVFHGVAGDRAPPGKRVRELWCVCSRRSGKSRIAAALSAFAGLFTQHKLAPGERGMVLVLAASVEQAKTVFSYAMAFLRASPVLEREIAECTAHEIRLKSGVIIAIHSNSYKTIRGRTLLAAIFDEVSFWRDETSSQPDLETYRAVMPSLATTNGMLVGISTPYRKMGLLHQKHRDYFGKDDADVLVVQGDSKRFNPTLDDAVIAAQRSADPTAAASEWDALFRTDLSSYLDDRTIEAAVDYDRPLELPPLPNTIYRAFVDASGGRHDHYTLAVGHKAKDGRLIIDCCTGRQPPLDPGFATKELAGVLKRYCSAVVGDAYSMEWTQSAWRSNNISYTVSALNKSALYIETLPLYMQGLVSLPDHARLLRELRLLERRTHRSGKDSVDHGRSGSDDYANAVAGVLYQLGRRGFDSSYSWVADYGDTAAAAKEFQAARFTRHVLGYGGYYAARRW